MNKKGLTNEEVLRVREHFGYNEIKNVHKTSGVAILLRQITGNFVIYLLIVAALLSFVVDKSITAYTILAIILLVIVTGFVQEYRAETSMGALRKMIAPVSVVIRNNKQEKILSRELVPGDLVLLRTGERVPVDGIILEATNLKLNESLLTGESSEVEKARTHDVASKEDKHRVFMGTFVVSGRALIIVTETGMKTRFGSIARMISHERKELPLQKKINSLTRSVVVFALFFGILTGCIYALRIDQFTSATMVEALLVAIALSVAVFPESFPVVLITTLSVGAHRMALKNAIVNRMSVIETLGETTVICSDKTGTLTKGEMTAKFVYADGKLLELTGTGYGTEGDFIFEGTPYSVQKDKVLSLLCTGSVACNDASITLSKEDKTYTPLGTATETALLVMAAKAGLFKEDLHLTRHAEIPFSSERKFMSVLTTQDKKSYLFTKGAPEYILDRCNKIQRKDGMFTLTSSEMRRVAEAIKSFTTRGYRTIAFAYKPTSKNHHIDGQDELTFLGFVALEDPPRPEVVTAIRDCMHAGIAVKMITGDHKETAIAIASQIGLRGPLLTGEEMDRLSDDDFFVRVPSIAIFARVRPEHKLRIVNALKRHGEVVTMTGDGVNDAPALKASQIGVAMGQSGTDVSRSVADITLKDDNFATIFSAVKEGRTIFNNMRKFVTYQFSCSFAEIMIIFLGVALGLPLPLLAIQILFMNLVTSDLPAVTLGLNPSSDDIMAHKPRIKAPLLSRDHKQMLFVGGLLMGLGTLIVYYYAFTHASLTLARTVALVTLICFEIVAAFNFRSFRKLVFNRSPFINRYLLYASLISLGATFAILYTPLASFFETAPLDLHWWIVAILPSFFLALIFDVLKYFNNRYSFWKEVY